MRESSVPVYYRVRRVIRERVIQGRAYLEGRNVELTDAGRRECLGLLRELQY